MGGRSVDTARRLQVFSPFLSQSVLRNLHLHTHDQKGAARDAGTERERPGLRWGNRADGASVVCSWTLPLLQGMTSAFLSIRTRRTCHGVEGRWGGGTRQRLPRKNSSTEKQKHYFLGLRLSNLRGTHTAAGLHWLSPSPQSSRAVRVLPSSPAFGRRKGQFKKKKDRETIRGSKPYF